MANVKKPAKFGFKVKGRYRKSVDISGEDIEVLAIEGIKTGFTKIKGYLEKIISDKAGQIRKKRSNVS